MSSERHLLSSRYLLYGLRRDRVRLARHSPGPSERLLRALGAEATMARLLAEADMPELVLKTGSDNNTLHWALRVVWTAGRWRYAASGPWLVSLYLAIEPETGDLYVVAKSGPEGLALSEHAPTSWRTVAHFADALDQLKYLRGNIITNRDVDCLIEIEERQFWQQAQQALAGEC